MSNKNVRLKVRLLIRAEAIRDKSDAQNRPGRSGPIKTTVIDVPIVEIPYTEFIQRLSDAQNVIRYGNVIAAAIPPRGVTDDVVIKTHNSARLPCTVWSNEVSTAVAIMYGITEALGWVAATNTTPINSADPVSTYYDAAGLSPNTKYYYRVRCISATKTTYGLIKSFTTSVAPV
jgi:hypothetical protein